MTVAELDALPGPEARAALVRCCGADRWVETMLAARPFGDRAGLLAAADRADAALGEADWREAFAHHPRIGDVAALRERFAATAAWAGDEQRGATGAPEATLLALAEGNRAYEARFGWIFIVYATGRNADEMLALLRARLGNDPARELAIAAGEQARITRSRLDKLLAGAAS